MEVAPEAQGLGDASMSSSLTDVGFRGSGSVYGSTISLRQRDRNIS